ncbi:TIGR03086 family metal-binding protein [Williamsia soli]|uniref:TIGR03086 family metal-binding protein n=1 Tax=Williamsia soli TaxID=364929 RepID=UPI001A9E9CAB|nr:TIGR03086 family metal-binding protein [Williamsia soli]
MTTTTVDLLRPVLADLAVVVENSGGHESAPTPCTELDVAQLRNHIAGWLTTFASGFADPEGRAEAAGADVPPAAADAAAAIRSAADRLDTAVRSGADQRPLYLGESPMPGEMAMSMILWEYIVHGWDLAVATGQEWDPAPEAAAVSAEFAPTMLTDDYQGPGKTFGPRVETSADATDLDTLLGLSGRDPHWSAPA